MNPVVDQAAREAAIDPARSFIVQAPAGSGKTGLLTQRFLRLLAGVDAPEEILAITFTRKGAGEMRERILQALAQAAEDIPPDDPHARATWTLARAARARDQSLGWQLERHPTRLRVQTMDSFNAGLARQLPWLSGLGALPGIVDDTQALYKEAAERTLALVDGHDSHATDLADLLLHLDHRTDQAAALIASMLARRDQWLHRLLRTDTDNRQLLEAAIAAEVGSQLERTRASIPAELHGELVALADFAAEQLQRNDRESAILACLDLSSLPGTTAADLPAWRGLAELLLTAGNQWRAQVSIAIGFPSDKTYANQKLRMRELIAALREQPDVLPNLQRLRALPHPEYDPAQWRVLQALVQTLPIAAAQLRLVFAERGEADHAEIALRALQALGEDESPTDLALALDYRIQHILVDEFQDTSTSQFRLLQALIRGWTPGDGRSLFLVGDPMQSIYRFREAEVGLFLQARQHGIGDLPLEPLRLSVNFRSRKSIVDWVNQAFPSILAPAEDRTTGAVPFERAAPFDTRDAGGVRVHPQIGEDEDRAAEAAEVAALAEQRLAETEDGTVAILVRGRAHAAEILPALRQRGLGYQAVEIESLRARPVVQDLLALTRAIAHEGDWTAWLAVLRAPWCGLALADLHALSCMTDPPWNPSSDVTHGLSETGRQRLARVQPILHKAVHHRRRESLRHRVEATWHALGGPATVGSARGLEEARAFLALLDQLDHAGDLDDVNELEEQLARLYAPPDPQGSARLQIMTMHKAKGLEFDTVIVPGLHRGTRQDDKELLQWMERPRVHREADLLLAPVRPTGQSEGDPIYDFIRSLDKEKTAHEHARLLYVALTRAIRCLDLFGFCRIQCKQDDQPELREPASSGLLALLWPHVTDTFTEAWEKYPQGTGRAHEGAAPSAQKGELLRLAADWQLPEPATPIQWSAGPEEADPEAARVEFSWAGETVRIIGLIVHRFLQQIGDDGMEQWDTARIGAARPAVRAMLSGSGLAGDALAAAENRVVAALHTTITDATGRWILTSHTEAENEVPLTSWEEDKAVHHIIDRTFVDADSTRWIIDYKTGYREGGDIDGFLNQEAERYAPQLARYARILHALDDRPIRTLLYYPLLARAREVTQVDETYGER